MQSRLLRLFLAPYLLIIVRTSPQQLPRKRTELSLVAMLLISGIERWDFEEDYLEDGEK